MAVPAKKILKHSLKWLVRILAFLFLIIFLLFLVLQTQWGKNIVRKQAVQYLENKLKTRISIGSLEIDWLSHINLKKVEIEDQHQRKLLVASEIDVHYNLTKLLKNELDISQISLTAVSIKLMRSSRDSLFNYHFIPAAFSGEPDTKEVIKEKSQFKINVGKINLRSIDFLMDDQYGGQVYKTTIGSLQMAINKMDLDNMLFKASHLYADAINCSIEMFAPYLQKPQQSVTNKYEEPAPFNLQLDSAAITHTRFLMNDLKSNLSVKSNAGLLALSNLKFDLSAMLVSLTTARLHDHLSNVQIKTEDTTAISSNEVAASENEKPFRFNLQHLYLLRNEIVINDIAKPATQQKEIDYSHLQIKNIELEAHNTVYDGKLYQSDIQNFSMFEKSGFELKKLKTAATFGDTIIHLKKLELVTSQNNIQGDVSVSYASLNSLLTQPTSTIIDIGLQKTQLQLDELLLFQPALKNNESFKPLLGKKIFLQTKVTGALNQLFIPQLQIKESDLLLIATARIYNLPDVASLKIDLDLTSFKGTRKNLLALLPKNLLPDSLKHYIPEFFEIKGKYKGTLAEMQTDLNLISSHGNLGIKGTLKNITDAKKAVYNLRVNTDQLKMGQLLQDTTMGNISGIFNVKGKGYDLPTADLTFDALIKSAGYKGYTYQGLDAKGYFKNNILDAHVLSTDPNILLNSDTYLDLNKATRSFKTTTQIDYAELQKIGFMSDTFRFSGKLEADFPVLDSARNIGKLLASSLHLTYGINKVSMDSLTINASHNDTVQVIKLNSPLADLSLTGKYSLPAIPAAIKTILNRYIYSASSDTTYTKSVEAVIAGNVNIPDSFLFLLPGLKAISPFKIDGVISTDSSTIGFLTKIEKIKYLDYDIDSLVIAAADIPTNKKLKNLTYLFSIKNVFSPIINLEKSTLKGNIKQGIITGKVELQDDIGTDRYIVPYEIMTAPDQAFLKIGDSLMINKKYWSVNPDNFIKLNLKALKGSNLTISNKDEFIKIYADSMQTSGLPLELNLHQFRLKNISDIMTTDTTLVEGLANGKITLQSFEPMSFVSDVQIDSLRIKEINAGNLNVTVNNLTKDVLDAQISLLGSKNDVNFKGTYNTSTQLLDMNLDMKYFDLQNVEPFTSNFLHKVRGGLTGQLAVTGQLSDPAIVGQLITDSALAVYKEYGTYILLPKEVFTFSKGAIQFTNINFMDSSGHKGIINGDFRMNGFTAFDYNVKLKTTDFMIVGPKRYPEQKIYGPTSATAQVNITGNEKKVEVNGQANVSDKSALTYINSSDGLAREGDGLIEFFDPAHPEKDSISIKKKRKSNPMQVLLNMNIRTTPKSTVTIVLDEFSGDQIKIAGIADLNFSMNPGGEMQMTGKYTVENGDYDLSIAQLIKKKFTIQKGSTITWSGDIMKANMDIKAIYKVKTTAAELMNGSSTTPGIDKQKLNFDVYLLLSKELLKPDINFKIDMPEKEQQVFDGAVYTRLKQVNTIPSELNKQVMGLLAINHFIADNPFSSISASGSESFETRAFATAGNLLTQELTELVSNAVKGVDIDIALDVNEDYTSGKAQRNTDLKVGLTKSLANNRLLIYVGSSIAIEGQNQNSNALSGLAGDVKLEYLLSKDGKYRIKGFRVTESELSLQGEIVKTGVTFVVVLEFNKIKSVFKKRKNKN